MRANTLYRERGDGVGVARAAVEAVVSPMGLERQVQIVHDALAQLGGADPYLEARLLTLLPEFLWEPSREVSAVVRVREIVNQHHFPDVEGALLIRMGQVALYELRLDDAAELLVQTEQKLGGGGGVGLGVVMPLRYLLPIMTGAMDDGVAAIQEGIASARKVHDRLLELSIQLRLAGLALARGDFDQVKRLHGEMHIGGGYATALQLAAQAELEGDLQKALTALPDVREAGGLPQWVANIHAGRCRIRYLAGDVDGAKEELRGWAEAIAAYPSGGFNWSRFYPLTELGEALPALADDALAAAAFEELQLLSMFRWDPTAARGADAIAGALGLRLGHVDAAEARFQTGLGWATRGELPIEQGRNLEGLAEVARVRGNTPEAVTLLDRAAAIYSQYGARFYLDRVIRKKVELQGIGATNVHTSIVALANAVQASPPDLSPPAAADGTVTLLFSDIENSTPLNERLGDARYMEMLRAHNAIIEEQVRVHDGRVVKTIGDGYMVAFASARRGLECAIEIQRALTPGPSPAAAGEGSARLLESVRVRIGLHTGEMVRQGDDFFGRHVNLAARVASSALGGEIVVSDLVRGVVQGQAFAFDDLGERPMKGFEQPLRIWQLRWEGDSGPRHMSPIEIEIDKERQAREVAGIVGTPYFQDLRAQAKGLRQISKDG